jgi:CTP:molybdopterin cytidylyltransferase MocA
MLRFFLSLDVEAKLVVVDEYSGGTVMTARRAVSRVPVVGSLAQAFLVAADRPQIERPFAM